LKRSWEACASIRQSLSQFALTLTTKGGQQAIEGIKQQMETQVGPGAPIWDTNPPAVAGASWVSGPGTKLDAFKVQGATFSPDDVRWYVIMCCMTKGLPPTFLGDMQTSNLATATSLDRPTETVFLSLQEEWCEVFVAILTYVLQRSLRAPGGKLREACANPGAITIREAAKVRLPSGRWRYVEVAKDSDDIAIKCVFPSIREGDTLAYGAKMNPSGLHEAIDRVAKEIRWGQKETSKDPNKVIGKGFACFWKAPAMPPNAASSAFIKFNEDGSLNISASGMEIGQGYLTVMAQIAAEVLTVPVSRIRAEPPDTDRNAYEWQTVGSHVTWGCGNAVKAAALDVRGKMFEVVERALGFARDTLYLEDEKVKCRARPDFELPFKNFVISGIQTPHGNFLGGPILGSGVFMPEFTSALSDPETSQGGHPNVHYTVGAAAAGDACSVG